MFCKIRMKLHKLPSVGVESHLAQQTAFLQEKYLQRDQHNFANGRNYQYPPTNEFSTQFDSINAIKGGHGVPLTS